MSVLADKIEQLILHKLLEEEEENIVLRRNELADELNCAPSQISYVLSTRFSNDKGFLVESRRGSGGFVRIIRLAPKKQDRTPVLLQERLPAVSITMDDLDGFLYQLLKQKRITNGEAILMHQTFEALFKEVDNESQRMAVISQMVRCLNSR
ncbi:CtsR family transcriptional regulator [uncultured Megasphaera sp.]|uniref:CtsR family transcriptional regulator n=1 Tax=uncultured Megasphaera sp. TaxID=165188 RepID=UPI00265ACBCC|nr:CtsR family transcriptional regulator [uncultured Megasphaera sp.]